MNLSNKCLNCLEQCDHRYCALCTQQVSELFFRSLTPEKAYAFINDMDDENFNDRKKVLDGFFAVLND